MGQLQHRVITGNKVIINPTVRLQSKESRPQNQGMKSGPQIHLNVF